MARLVRKLGGTFRFRSCAFLLRRQDLPLPKLRLPLEEAGPSASEAAPSFRGGGTFRFRSRAFLPGRRNLPLPKPRLPLPKRNIASGEMRSPASGAQCRLSGAQIRLSGMRPRTRRRAEPPSGKPRVRPAYGCAGSGSAASRPLPWKRAFSSCSATFAPGTFRAAAPLALS